MEPPKKKRKSRKETNLAIITGAIIPGTLYDDVVAASSGSKFKNVFFDSILELYVTAWAHGEMPRTYLGAADGIHRTFYIEERTYNILKKIAKTDRVGVATVIRTAFGWYLHHKDGGMDVWGSDIVSENSREDVLALVKKKREFLPSPQTAANLRKNN